MISTGELSDPLCDSVNRGLTLVRLPNITKDYSDSYMYMYEQLGLVLYKKYLNWKKKTHNG